MEKLLPSVATNQPIVSFDIAVGERIPQGMVLDFDNDEFRAFCQAAAPQQPGAADGARLHVKSGYFQREGYLDGRGMVVTYSGNPETTNNSVRHESSHYFDYLDGRPGWKAVSVIANLSLRSLPVAISAGVMLGVPALHPEAPGWFRAVVATVAYAPLAGSFMYYLRPGERRARFLAEEYSQYNPLRLTPASDFQGQ